MLLTPVRVRSAERLSPSFVRIALGGPGLADFGVEGPVLDQRFKLLVPGLSGIPALTPQSWWTDLQALPEAARPAVRTYTIRAVRGTGADTEIVVDVVIHPGAHGPGSAWADRAAVGDEVVVCVPRRGVASGGIEWDPQGASRLLLVGDETAVPAVASILGSLPAGAVGTAILEVPLDADVQTLSAPDGVSVRWLPRNGVPLGVLAVEAVADLLGFDSGTTVVESGGSDAETGLWETPTYSSSGESLTQPGPADGRYAWIAGEAGLVKTLRRHLVDGLGLPRHQVAFMGYWRQGVAMRA